MVFSLIYKNNSFPDSEDFRTSTILGLILNLPDNLIKKILVDTGYISKDISILEWGKLQDYSFWPSWNSEGTDNQYYVEPDMFLHFEFIDVIVEVKRDDGTGQSIYQWMNEIRAYHNTFPNASTPLCLIALGGNNGIKKQDIIDGAYILNITWMDLRASVEKLVPCISDSSVQRIINQIFLAFDYFGFRSYSMLSKKNFISDYKVNEDISNYLISMRGKRNEQE